MPLRDLRVVGSDAPRGARGKSPQRSFEARPRSAARRPQGRRPVDQEYLSDVVAELSAELGGAEKRRMAPEEVLASLTRLRLRHGVRVADVQALTKRQPDGKLTFAEFRRLVRDVGAWKSVETKRNEAFFEAFRVETGRPAGEPRGEVGLRIPDELAQQAFGLVDVSQSHKVSWSELWQALTPSHRDVLMELNLLRKRRRRSISELVRPYDQNADDRLTCGEFHRFLDANGFDLSDQEVRALVKFMDLDGDRHLSCRELQTALDRLGGGRERGGLFKSSFERYRRHSRHTLHLFRVSCVCVCVSVGGCVRTTLSV